MIRYIKNERGTVIVLAALLASFLLGCTGLVIDIGNLYLQKTKMQNAVDAAVLAGGQELPDTSSAASVALAYITNNGEDAANASVVCANNNSRISITMRKKIPTFFMGALGISSVPVNASAAAILTGADGPFDYAIFSGSTTVSLPLNGSGFNIKGSVHTNRNLTINGSNINITGAAEAEGTVTTNGSNQTIGSVQSKASYISMPDYSASIAAAAAAAQQVYSGAKTLNGSNITASPMYVQGNVTVNGSAFTATGAVLADGNITINGSGAAAGDTQVCFYSKNGDIIVNGSNMALNGVLYAPNGRIIINGSHTTVNGCVVAEQVVINGGSFSVDREDNPVKTLPGDHVQLVE